MDRGARFALQVKGGRYLLVDGAWRLKTRDGVRLVESCPLDDTKLAALDLHDDIEELAKTTYNPYVIPVLAFPDMKPDEAIKNLAKRQGVYSVWGTGHLMADLSEIVHSRTSTSSGCPTTWAQTWPVAGWWPISRFSMMRICLGGFSLRAGPRGGVDPAAFAQTAKPGVGMVGTPFAGCHQGPASPEAVVSFLVAGVRLLVVEAGLSGWSGRHCWEHRTGRRRRDRQIPGWPRPAFWPGLPQRGAERARRYTVSIESARFVSHRRATRAERRRFDRLPEAPVL